MHPKPCKSLGGHKLREIREASRLSQSRFAILHGYSPSTIGLWENGRSLPDLPNAHRLERDFGIPTSDWMKDPPREAQQRAAAS